MKKIFLSVFLIPVLLSALLCDQYIFYPIQSYFGNGCTNIKGFRELGNPNRCGDSLSIRYYKYGNPSIKNFPQYISTFVPPYSRIGGIIYFNINADIGYSLKYKNIPKVINRPDINVGSGWQSGYNNVFPDEYYNEYYFKNSGGADRFIRVSRNISESQSGWLFFNPVYWEGGIGIMESNMSISVDCSYTNNNNSNRVTYNPTNFTFNQYIITKDSLKNTKISISRNFSRKNRRFLFYI